jgi:hypothetical protein
MDRFAARTCFVGRHVFTLWFCGHRRDPHPAKGSSEPSRTIDRRFLFGRRRGSTKRPRVAKSFAASIASGFRVWNYHRGIFAFLLNAVLPGASTAGEQAVELDQPAEP